MEIDAARARGDLSAIKRPSAASAAKVPRVPHPDSNKIVTNTDAEAWALRVLQRKQARGEALDAQQLATLARLSASSSSSGSSGGGGGGSAAAAASAAASSSPSKKIVVVTGRSGAVVRVAGGSGDRQGARPGGGLGSATIGSRIVSKKFGGGAAAEARPLSTADKLGMSLEDLAKLRAGK
jgi:hypothetical protein